MEDRFYFRYWDGSHMMMIGLGTLAEGSHGEIDLSEVKIMQCTGLRDKNGKLIYEGDILKSHPYNEAAEIPPQEIYWNHKNGAWGLKQGNEWTGNDCPYAKAQNHADYEIIGNIHENPELLKV